jgi:hypothetical protein
MEPENLCYSKMTITNYPPEFIGDFYNEIKKNKIV